ncbi:MAG: DNA polymerase III subunit gamma/tau [Clostridia bacterium]|nr:DNA polymerase III subunit gamma/tau [Clostridia bacterium]
MYKALYRQYRPEVFDEVLGQDHIVRILKNQIATSGTSHAYLFCGTRGTGKTTTARLLAKGLNCLSDGEKPCGVCANCQAIRDGSFLDVIEIDAASNNGVDDVRELRESVKYPPAVGRMKVYIIDEVHMLSTEAFNALLKTLEEPPEYVTFILATTEVHKLPATVLSRCMRLDFRRVPESVLIRGMEDICAKIGIDVTEDALRIIAANADGSVRDGLSILDQCISGRDNQVTAEEVLEFLGASGDEDFIEITELVRRKKTEEAIVFLDGVLSDGKDVRQFMRDWISHYRNLLMVRFMRNPETVINMSAENIERIRRQAAVMELEDINRGIMELSSKADEARWSTQPRILLELAIVRLCMGAGQVRELTEVEFEEPPIPARQPAAPVAKAPPEPTKPEPEPASEVPQHEPQPEPSAAKAPETFDCEDIWNKVFEDGESEKGSFYIIRNSGRLTSIDEDTFSVSVSSDITKQQAEKNRKLIEHLVEKHTGKFRMMKLILDESIRTGRSAEEIAAEGSDLLGIQIDIQ